MTKSNFSGDKKVGESILAGLEKALIAWGTPKIPKYVQTYHLTLLTILWSSLNPLFGYFAKHRSIHWLWLVSLMLVLQYITDLFDGAIGRSRETGLIRWGFYMDHFLDYIFLCSLILTWYIIAPQGLAAYFIILLILMVGFMMSFFLRFAATNQFQICYFGIGPTEIQVGFIFMNTTTIFTGTRHFAYSIPALCLVCLVSLIIVVINTSIYLWKVDTAHKENQE
jgi:phosphatidylglycerophosphate synthase